MIGDVTKIGRYYYIDTNAGGTKCKLPRIKWYRAFPLLVAHLMRPRTVNEFIKAWSSAA